MRWYRFLSVLGTSLGVILVAGMFRGPISHSAERTEPEAPPEVLAWRDQPPQPLPTAYVEEALAKLNQPERPWLRTNVLVRSHLPELSYVSRGTYLRAAGQRSRLELRGTCREGTGPGWTLLVLSDGRTSWVTTRVGDKLREVRQLGKDQNPAEMLCGPETMLQRLHHHLAWVHADVHGESVTICGIWHEQVRKHLVPQKEPWPASLPRVCRLTLHGADRWPTRLEWWGPRGMGGPDRLLVEVEFHDPKWNCSLSDEDGLRLFSLDAESAQLAEVTLK